jgi:hypothetical protein
LQRAAGRALSGSDEGKRFQDVFEVLGTAYREGSRCWTACST